MSKTTKITAEDDVTNLIISGNKFKVPPDETWYDMNEGFAVYEVFRKSDGAQWQIGASGPEDAWEKFVAAQSNGPLPNREGYGIYLASDSSAA